MSRIPAAMRENNRHPVPHFDQEEFLYRRIPPDCWDDPAAPIDVNAVNLPDISVGRSRFGHPEWLRVDIVIDAAGQKHERYFEQWAVIGFKVNDIPSERWADGVFHYTFASFHDPEEHNYPHSEIRCFQNGVHVNALEKLPEEMHLKWRELLLRSKTIFLKPRQPAAIRQTAPVSHKPELPIPQ
jgi:hypothetical protein